MKEKEVDVIIIGAGAAGMMCAIEAGKRNRKVAVLEHAARPGKKILISGGGRCNFTNYYIDPEKYISHNLHFCKSALSRYSQWDFIELVKRHRISFYEKKLGQLFCQDKAKKIVEMLLTECEQASVQIYLNTKVKATEQMAEHHFKIDTDHTTFYSQSLVIASGGLSFPTMGATAFGYQVAEQFGIKVWQTRAGLVPFHLPADVLDKTAVLTGIAMDCLVSKGRNVFRENVLFTHRGLSGPAILQISSYWQPGEIITINFLPEICLLTLLKTMQQVQPQKQVKSIVTEYLPKRFVEFCLGSNLLEMKLGNLKQCFLEQIAQKINAWQIMPNGTEGYRTAEVTLGGIDCHALSSKTLEAQNVPGLYFIGEVVDVTGWLGGYNFQWAWGSGWAAGQVV